MHQNPGNQTNVTLEEAKGASEAIPSSNSLRDFVTRPSATGN